MKIELRNGRVIDPASGRDSISTVYCAAGRIVGLGATPEQWTGARVIDARGLIVCPGLIDLAVRVGNPGSKGGIHLESELRAAVAGGVTSVVTLPDTQPILDEPGLIEIQKFRAQLLSLAHVLPLGALTNDLAGETLTEMAALHDAGCVGFTQAERAIPNTQVLFRAMQYAASCGYTVWLRPQDAWLGASGVMHEGEVSSRLGLPGIPAVAESMAVATLLSLAQESGCRLHLCRLSSAASVTLVRAAKKRGASVTCDVSAAHLHLIDVDVGFFDANLHVRPPFRSATDRAALRAGVGDGTIDAIVSDHTPLADESKQLPFAESAPGISGIETLLPLVLKWANAESVPLAQALALITRKAATITGAAAGGITIGAPADLCVFDETAYRVLSHADFQSAGKNSPFLGYELPGIVRHTLVGGRIVYDAPSRA